MVIQFTIPDAVAADLLNALAVKYGYPETVMQGGAEVPNPETKRAFVKRRISSEWVEVLAAFEGRAAGNAAEESARGDVRRRIIIT